MTTKENDLLSPDASPGALDEKVGVRRVNNRPLYILAAGLGVFLIIIAMVAYDRSVKAQRPAAAPAQSKKAPVTTATFAKAAIGDNESGMIAPADPSADLTPPPELPPNDGAAKPSDDTELKPPKGGETAPRPTPPIREMDGDPQLHAPGQRGRGQREERRTSENHEELSAPRERQQPDNDLQRLRELKFKQFEEAVKGRSAVTFNAHAKRGVGASAGAVAAPALGKNSRESDLSQLAAIKAELASLDSHESTTKTYQDRVAEIRGKMPSVVGESAAAAPSTTRNDLAKFDGNSDRWKLDSVDEAPADYQLTTGDIIPVTLLTEINSELPGPIIAQVSRNIYDTATRKHILIPQGTKVYGAYSSDIVYGQASLMVAGQRLVYPDGKTRDMGSMPAADAAGSTGMRDQINNHYARIFGSAFLMSGITAGIAMSQPNQGATNGPPTARTALSESLGQQLGQTTSQMLSKNLNIAPTLMIRPGYRFNIIVVKDMIFKTPYKPFDYKRKM